MNTKIATLSLHAYQEDGELTVYTSKNNRNQKCLIVLAEIYKTKEQQKKIIKTLTSELEETFLHSQTGETEKTLEDALQKVNFSLSELVKQTKKDWLLSSHIIIAGVNVENGEISFAKIGKVAAYLAQPKDIISITEEAPDGEVNPVKPFANLYSGTLPEDTAMLFLTENILDYISLEKLRSLAIALSPREFRDTVEELLGKAPKTNPFGAFVIKKENSTKEPLEQREVSHKLHKHAELHKMDIMDIKSKEHVMKKKQEEKLLSLPPVHETSQNNDHLTDRKNVLPPLKKKPIVLKIIAASIIAIISVLLFNVFTQSDTSREAPVPEQTPPTDQEILEEINTKFLQAQNDLILNQKEKAKMLLTEIQGMIKTLPEDTEAKKQQKEFFARKIAIQLLLAEGVNLTKEKLHTEFADANPTALLRKEDTLYSFNPIDTVIYQTPQSGESAPSKLEITADKVGSIEKVLDHTGEGILFYHSGDGLMQLHVEKKSLAPIVWERTWKGAPKAADIYQNKLYVITGDAKLFKYTRSITGFTQEGNWLSADVPTLVLTGAISMAIDGSVWVLKENGEILKFFKGKQAPFAYSLVPPLKKPVKIFTDLDLAHLYILDAQTRRVVILNKEGKLINQLTAEEFLNPTDMAVDEKGRKIYLLDGNKIFEITF